jgi:hypothetical protein
MNIRVLVLLVFFSVNLHLNSQSLSNQVIVPVAGIMASGSITYSQTIGETAVEIIKSPEIVFTQGFQQPRIILSQIEIPGGNGVEVYPNPATEFVTVKLFGDSSRDFIIEVLNITGTVVYSDKESFSDAFYSEVVIPVNSLYNGIYFIRVLSTDKMINRTFKIEKM